MLGIKDNSEQKKIFMYSEVPFHLWHHVLQMFFFSFLLRKVAV